MIAARAGARNGTLAESLRDAAIRHTHKYEQSTGVTSSPSLAVLYLTAVPLLAVLIVTGVMTYIIPKFKAIFEGFNTDLPGLTIRLIDISDLSAKYWYLLSPFFMLAMGGTVFLACAYVVGFNEFDLPVFKRWLRRLSLPNLLRIFASTVREQRPLDETVNMICASHARSAVRTSMDEVYHLMQAGEDPWQAMQSQKLLTKNETAALQSAQRAGNLSWALEQLAESLDRRFTYRWKTWLEFLQPAIVIVLGIGVGFICIALFLPLVKLLNDLS
jgi:type II secretory pathway component PulF